MTIVMFDSQGLIDFKAGRSNPSLAHPAHGVSSVGKILGEIIQMTVWNTVIHVDGVFCGY